MFDGINALYHIPGGAGSIATLPCWEVLVNEQTGTRVDDCKTATLRGLHLAYKPSVRGGHIFNVKGSLHKWFNAGIDNTGRFTIADVQTAVTSLCHVFEIDPGQVELHGLEIGVNIPLPFPALRVLKNIVCYKGKPFVPINRKNTRKGLVCTMCDYEVKLYDKAAQTGNSPGNVLRLEVKANKMRFLNDYGFISMADLTDTRKAYAARKLLFYILGGIVWTDTTVNMNQMSSREQKQWIHLSNANSWERIPKEKAYRQRKRLAILFTTFAKFDTGRELCHLLSDTWESLFSEEPEAQKAPPFHQLISKYEANENITFSHLECTGKRLHMPLSDDIITKATFCEEENHNINGAKTAPGKKRGQVVRRCRTCSKDISYQRINSRFCSAQYVGEKSARKCRNKNSNRRRNLKCRINAAIEKDNFISVTYMDNMGNNYKDTLHPSELQSMPSGWLDRILSVTALPIRRDESTQILDSDAAKRFLQTIIS